MTGDMAGVRGRSVVLDRLVERVQSIEAGVSCCGVGREDHDGLARVSTGWDVFDQLLGGGLCRGRLHEWFGVFGSSTSQVKPWAPPLAVLSHCVERALGKGVAIWFGRSVWPYARLLSNRVRRLSLFVDLGNQASLSKGVFVWAVEMALRCHSASVVIADGRGLSMAASRRLQLAAEEGGGLCLLARSPNEYGVLSAASTRWRVSWCQSQEYCPRWRIELMRMKGCGVGFRSMINTEGCIVEGFCNETHGLRVVA
ncbi:MAG: hypothetical protein P8J86_13130 [Phycisphaerales bacterium]|nr:hypothetical protein [Phycisphaerales bacterium]